MSDEQIIEILSNNDFFEIASPLGWILREFGWGLIKILSNLANGLEGVVNEIYSLNGFFRSQEVDNLINQLMPLIWVILAVSIAFLGLKIILDRDFKVNDVIKNLVLTVAVVMLLPMGMTHLEKITTEASKGLKYDYNFSSEKVIKDNFCDLYYLDEVGFDSATKNNIPAEKITSDLISINEEVDSKETENKDLFKSKLVTDSSGNYEKRDLKKTFFGLFSEKYYRYDFKFWTIFITIGCIVITLLCTCFKVARIIFELGFVKLFGILYSFADISNGQKIKEVIRCIVSNFVVLFCISILLKMYVLFSTWTSNNSQDLTKFILLIASSVAVIDGPNIIERILGIDSGVKSGWSMIAGGYVGAKAGIETGKGLYNMGKSAIDFAKDRFKGGKEGASSKLEDQMSKASNENKFGANSAKNLHDEIEASKNSNSSSSADGNFNSSSNSNSNANSSDTSNINANMNGSIDSQDNGIGGESLEGAMNNTPSNNDKPPTLEEAMNSANNIPNNIPPTLESAMNSANNIPNDMPPTLESAMNGIDANVSGSGIEANINDAPPKLESAMNSIDSGTISADTSKNSLEQDMNNNTIGANSLDNSVKQSSLDFQINNDTPNVNSGSDPIIKSSANNIERRNIENTVNNTMPNNQNINNQSFDIGRKNPLNKNRKPRRR